MNETYNEAVLFGTNVELAPDIEESARNYIDKSCPEDSDLIKEMLGL